MTNVKKILLNCMGESQGKSLKQVFFNEGIEGINELIGVVSRGYSFKHYRANNLYWRAATKAKIAVVLGAVAVSTASVFLVYTSSTISKLIYSLIKHETIINRL